MGRSFKNNRKWNGGNDENHISLLDILTGQAGSTKESISNSVSVLYKKEYIAKKIDNKHTSDIIYTIDNNNMKVTRDGTGPYKVVFLSIV